MHLAQVDGDKFRIMVYFSAKDTEPPFVKFKGHRYHKAAALKLRAKEKELWDRAFIYERRKWEG